MELSNQKQYDIYVNKINKIALPLLILSLILLLFIIGVMVRNFDNSSQSFKKIAAEIQDDNSKMSKNEVKPLRQVLAAVSLGSGLIGYWPLNGNADDLSGNAYLGSLIGGPVFVPGRFGQGLSFDDVDDGVQIEYDPDFNVSYITVSAWVNKKVADENDWGIIVARQFYSTGVDQDLWQLFYDFSVADNYMWCVRTTTSVADECVIGLGSSSGDVNKWFHLVGTYDGTTLSFYKNGVLIGSRPLSGTILPEVGSHICIGTSADDATRSCATGVISHTIDAIIDDVRIYNRALNQCEISTLAQVALPPGCPVVTLFPTTTTAPKPPPGGLYGISGNVYVDVNRNMIKDGSEGDYGSGTVVSLTGSESRTTITDVFGNYNFSGLYGGTFTVTLTVPGGYQNTTPISEIITLP